MYKKQGRPKILLVEDSEDNRVMMKRLLELSGYEVTEAVNGEQAVEKAKRLFPDLILMDLSLPRVDGLAATRLIRAIPILRRVPIIVVSAHDTSDFHAEAMASGCNEYVTKPIDFGELDSLLQELVPSH
ncbi:MAG TPA: response regulator [Pyrinomonadaceae bacterium]|jgi:CheY-like chemotaxis protein|nr:response regulator [Pyrinomonadaceae bacterium]